MVSFADTNDTHIATPSPITDSATISLYEYYHIGSEPYQNCIRLNRDFTVDHVQTEYDSAAYFTCERNGKKVLGDWRLSHDSLYLYLYYYRPADTIARDYYIKKATPLQLRDSDYMYEIEKNYGERFIPDYFPSLPRIYPYARNVLVFKVENYGQILKPVSGITDEGRYIPESEFSDNTWGWQKIAFHWDSGEYEVTYKLIQGGHTQLVHLVRDGIRFMVVNPRYYLQNIDCKLYDPKDLPSLSDWMDSVNTNDTLNFTLSRPAYCIDYDAPDMIAFSPTESYIGYFTPELASTQKKSPHYKISSDRIITYNRLKPIPDSLWISRGGYPHEAYGYFFAQPTNTNHSTCR